MFVKKVFAAAAVAAFASGAAAQSKGCIANVCTQSGTLPNGTYRYDNGRITTPGGLPADAYVRDPRTGQRRLVNPQTGRNGSLLDDADERLEEQRNLYRSQALPPAYRNYFPPIIRDSAIQPPSIRRSSPAERVTPRVFEGPVITTLEPTFSLVSGNVHLVCDSSLLEPGNDHDVSISCAHRRELSGRGLQIGEQVPHPFSLVFSLSTGDKAFCNPAHVKKDKKGQYQFELRGPQVPAGQPIHCIVVSN